MASFIRTVRAPATPRSSAVTASPARLVPMTIRPRRSRMSARPVVKARMAMISEATVMSKPVSRTMPFSSGPSPILTTRRKRSLMSRTRFQVRLAGSMSRRNMRRFSSGVRCGGIGLVDAELPEPAEHDRGEAALALLVGRAEGVEELLVVLARLVEDADVDGRGQQVVRGRDGVDVPGQVEVEVLHGHDLGVSAAGGAALDAEGRAHAGLADDRDHLFPQMGAEGLAQADGGGRLALAEGRRGDGRHVHVTALGAVLEPVEDVEVDLGLVLAVEVEVVLDEAELGGHFDDGVEGRRLGDVDVARDGLDGFHGHAAGLPSLEVALS